MSIVMEQILQDILSAKKMEVKERRELYPVKLLESSTHFDAPTVSLRQYLRRPDKLGIIAEIKRRSPSRGVINDAILVEELSVGYMQAGASALSILTDSQFFGGTNQDLTTARQFNFCPILRKDFIIDSYQVIEARSIGADAILLIAAVVERSELVELAEQAHSLGLEVLLEIHNEAELQRCSGVAADVIGVNSRNLRDFKVDLDTTFELAGKLPANVVKIAESGIHSAQTIVELRAAGFDGFLIGEAFMRTSNPALTCAELIGAVRRLEKLGGV